MSSKKKSESLLPVWIVCGVLSIAVGWVDLWRGSDIVRQWSTAGHAQTQGTVGTSFVTKDFDGRQTSYDWIAGYNYTVDGQSYTSTQVGHGFEVHSRSQAEEYTKRFAVNSTVPVYYPSDDPADAVLLQGIQGYSLIHVIWLYALHLILLGAWYALFLDYRRRADGIGATVIDGRTYVPVSLGLDGWIRLCVGLFITSAVLYFFDSLPSMLLMSLVWAAILATTVSVALRRAAQRKAGAFDLILDERQGRLSVPPLAGDAAGMDLPLSGLRGSQLEPQTRPGHNDTQVNSWTVVLLEERNRGGHQSMVVANLDSHEHAQNLSAWLNQACSRKPRESPPPAVV